MGQSTISPPAVFVRVVELGSVRAAAKALGMPRSNVSRRLADLEAQLGVRLLHRTTRRISLTEAGRAYQRGASVAVAALLDAEREARALQSEPRGLLRVTAPVAFADYVSPLVDRFLRAHPGVSLTLDLTDRIVDLVEERFDVAIRAGPLPEASSFAVRRLAGTLFVTVASPAHLAAHGTPTRPAALSQHPCLLHGAAHQGSWRFPAGRRHLDVPVQGPLACTSFQVLADAAAAGVGIARVPFAVAAGHLAAGRLVRLLPKFEPPEAPLHVVIPTHRYLPPKVRVFVDMLVETFAALPWAQAVAQKNRSSSVTTRVGVNG